MAEPRYARVLASEPLGGGYHRVVCRAEASLDGRAGQWLAVATDLPHPQKPGEGLRRAWSLAALDGDRFELLIAVVGPGSSWLAARRAGDALRFTGPWGAKFTLDEGPHGVGLYATGSGLSPIAALADAALAADRATAIWWDTAAVPDGLADRIAGWRARGARVVAGPGARPAGEEVPGVGWWLAGDGARLAAVAADLTPTARSVRVERFYPLEPRA